jgi:AcrR family transcriptional regulator
MSPRTKEQNLQLKDERREQILSAAVRVFARRGLAATKISDIAATAKLSHGLVYHYFESKEKVFIELVNRAVESAAESIKMVDSMPLEPLEKIRIISEYVTKSIYEDEESAYYFLLMVQAYVSDANPEEVWELIGGAFGPDIIMQKIVAEGQKQGTIHDGNSEDYSTLYWAAIQGLALAKIAYGENFKMPSYELLLRIFKK